LPATAQVAPPQLDLRDYARTRAADAAGNTALAAAGYARALDAVPDDQVLAMRAYRQALAAGDFTLASRAATVLDRATIAPPDTALLAFTVALHAGDRAGEDRALQRLAANQLDFLVPVLRAWVAFDRKQDPLPALDASRGNGLAAPFTARHRALLLIALGRSDEGLFALAATGGADQAQDPRIDAAIALLRAGKGDKAETILSGLAGASKAWRKREAKAGKPDAAFGAAILFLGLASDLRDADMAPLSILLTRAALLLDPQEDRARLLLADALSRSNATDAALQVLAGIRLDGPFARSAAAGQVGALRRADRVPEALALSQKLADAQGATPHDLRSYGELLFQSGRYGEAATAFGKAIDKSEGNGGWELTYLRGAALDRAGKWDEALPVLQRAVYLGPQEPEALAWLGNAQVERGVDLPGAQDLLERARRIKPDDPEITDSLGRAYLAEGKLDKALPLLETAVRADPGNARANEHLGDAYWQLGRRMEARYAWRAAEVTAEDGDLPRIKAKIADGPAK
jgi:Flp pilus assembly protein TadD